MSNEKRDILILQKIMKYCDQITDARSRFGDTQQNLASDIHYMNSTAMSILQIGELTTHLSENFKSAHVTIPWQSIKGMRNIAAHGYEQFKLKYLWETITGDIPALRTFCMAIVEQQDTNRACIQEPGEDYELGL